MVFSLIRGGLILFLSGFLTYFFVSIENIPGSLNLELHDKEFKISLLSSVLFLIFFGCFFWVLLKLLSFSLAVLDFLSGKDQIYNQKLIDVRNEFDKYNLISALHTLKSRDDKIYKNLLPPLDLLDSVNEKNLLQNLKKLNFQINSKLAA